MARIEQYSYPISAATVFPFIGRKCRLGISISEKEFMELVPSTAGTAELDPCQVPDPYLGFSFILKTASAEDRQGWQDNQIINMGRTCMYQMDTYEKIEDFRIISPSDKIIKTALIQVVYDQEREGEINE